jgi:hypothetical protein
MLVMTMRGPAQQGSVQAKSSAIPIEDVSAQADVVDADASPGTEGVHANEVEP